MVSYKTAGGVAVVLVVGLLSAACLRPVARSLRGVEARAAVVDLRRAVVVATPDEIAEVVADEPHLARLPAALLASAGNIEVVRAWAWEAAQMGILRVPFTDYEKALEWAQREAEWRTAP